MSSGGIPAARASAEVHSGFAPPLQVVGFIARGAAIRNADRWFACVPTMRLIRLLDRRGAGACDRTASPGVRELVLDDTLPRGGVVLRDVAGAA